jgi:hypothetical protein
MIRFNNLTCVRDKIDGKKVPLRRGERLERAWGDDPLSVDLTQIFKFWL